MPYVSPSPSAFDDGGAAPLTGSAADAVEALDRAPFGYLVLDDQWTLIYQNAAGARLFGKRVDDLVGRSIWQVFPEAVNGPFWAAYHRVMATRVGEELTALFDPLGRWFKVSAFPTGSGIGVIFTDATDERRNVEALAALRRQLEDAQKLVQMGSWSWDVVTGETIWSLETYRLLGFDPGTTPTFEMVLSLAVDDAQRDRFLLQVQDALAGVRPYHFVSRIRRSDGMLVDLENIGSVERAPDGTPIRMTGVFKDVTAERRAAEELQALQQQIQQTQKLESLGVLAGGIAHDFNNLLVGVLTNASYVLDALPLDDALRAPVREIRDAGERASELTRQLLAYSGRAKFVVESLDLSTLVSDMLPLLKPALGAGAKLTLNMAADLPRIRGDATQIRQVVMNLITNAADAIVDTQGSIVVTTRLADSDDTPADAMRFSDRAWSEPRVVLTVADTGIGMTSETLQRIFDPFFTTKFTGRGLGLAASLGILRGHNGSIAVTSAPGIGTSFHLSFPPDAEAPPPTVTVPSGNGVTDETPPHAAGQLVLVVDDDAPVRNVLERSLQRLGYRTVIVDGGVQALEAIRQGLTPDLVCLDLTMPEMSGRELMRLLAVERPTMPVVLMSGYNEDAIDGDRGVPRPVGFLSKPFTTLELATVLRAALAASSQG
ncbi:MAG: ATP-binding protein [Gemmatimonadaceae bacterium]|nr:ATP-binding protein [Gemmatimonadaceae bacterium]